MIPAIVVILLKYAGIPLLAVLAVVTAPIAAKALRRRRRRTLGPPSARAARAWRELLDLGRDLGIAPAAATQPAASRRRWPRHGDCPRPGRWQRRPTRPSSARPNRTTPRRPGSGRWRTRRGAPR